jgi:hypothetical protein
MGAARLQWQVLKLHTSELYTCGAFAELLRSFAELCGALQALADNSHYCLVSLMWMKIGSAVMILLRRCLECLKNYFHLWGLQKSLVATPLVIFSVAPLVNFFF